MESFFIAKIAALMAVLLLGSANGQALFKNGDCPVVEGQGTFDSSQYVGTWYEYQRFPAPYQAGVDCSTATYTADGATINVKNSGTIRTDTVTEVTAEGVAVVIDPFKPAELGVLFTNPPSPAPPTEPNYIVVDTDYTTYSVVYACRMVSPTTNIQNAWILTREAGVAPPNLAELESNLEAAGVDVSDFDVVNQNDCPGR
ncbi:apolipoprotein d [Plakobranchus ocellatus]|uniref:Apolipoprotein D n=1 Tax=Plakobranchus ocellatus TaxID=259542 RepID=A0AAV4BWH4_9GAST|nr:apolipoprotein d [Plakobranchus ocellatus]